METTAPQAMQAPDGDTPKSQKDGTEDHGCQTGCSGSGAAVTMLRELSINSDVVAPQNASDFWAHAPDPEPWPERINKSPTPPPGDGIRNSRNASDFTSRSFESRSRRPRRRRELTRREILEILVEQQYLPRLTDPSQRPVSSRNQHKPRPFYPAPVRTQRVYISPEELALIKRQRGETVGNASFNGDSTSVIGSYPTQSSLQPRVATPGNDILQLSQGDAAMNQTTSPCSSLDIQASSVDIPPNPQDMVPDKTHRSPDSSSTMLAVPVSRTSTLARSPISTSHTPQWDSGCGPDIHSDIQTMPHIPIFVATTNSSSTAANSGEACPEPESPQLAIPTAIFEPSTSYLFMSSFSSSPYLSSYTADLASLVYPIDYTPPTSDEGVSVIASQESQATSNSLPSSHTTPYSASLNDLIGLDFF